MPSETKAGHAGLWEGLQCPNCGEEMLAFPSRISCQACGMEATLDENVARFPVKREEEKKNVVFFLEKGCRALYYPLIYLASRRVARYYERCLFDQNLAKEFREHYLPSIFSSSRGAALDFGCGRGRIAALLSLLGFQVTGLDFCPNPYWKKLNQARFVVFGEDKLPFSDSTFDLITHFQTLMYIKDPEKHLQELQRVLKPGGYLTLQVANRCCLRKVAGGKFGDTKFYQAYSMEELESLFAKSGFQVEKIFAEGFYSPVFPYLVNFFRTVIFTREFNYFDRNSLAVRLTPKENRGLINVMARKG